MKKAGTLPYAAGPQTRGFFSAQLFTASLSPLPALNFGCFEAGIWIVSPVRGLRPSVAARFDTLNVPKPTTSPREARIGFLTHDEIDHLPGTLAFDFLEHDRIDLLPRKARLRLSGPWPNRPLRRGCSTLLSETRPPLR